jgi:predicted HicB family RNase H-like nuclease
MARSTEVQLKLRMMEALRSQLARAAKQSRRSINSEIIHRLERTFLEDAGAAGAAAGAEAGQRDLDQFIEEMVDQKLADALGNIRLMKGETK